MEVVVLAAGQGKRMRAVLPKVLQPIAGSENDDFHVGIPVLGWLGNATAALRASDSKSVARSLPPTLQRGM